MEDLRNLMACIDEISSQIPDGMYLKMADQMKRVHEHMNGNKSIHDDTFYYSDDDSVLDSDDDSDSDFAPNLDRRRLSDIALLRDQLLDRVKKMHEEYKVLMKWEKEARRTDWTPIKRMTAFRKTQAIKLWCEKNTRWAPGGEAGELVGHLSTAAVPTSGWTWKNLVENGLRTIVVEIATEEEKVLGEPISSTMMNFHSKHSKSFPPLRRRFTMTTRKNAKGPNENAKLKSWRSQKSLCGDGKR